MSSIETMRSLLDKCDQSHLLQFWDELSSTEQQFFFDQLSSINFEEVNRLFKKANSLLTEDVTKLDSRMKPVPDEQFESEQGVSPDVLEEYRTVGLNEIANNRVGVLLLGGGQGTRLGVSYPKGMYSVDLPSDKSLFQIQAERIRKIASLAKMKFGKTGKICWYIMTSGPTHETTKKYLKENKYFGLNESDVVLFQQGLLPCFDYQGKIILDGTHSVALAPDGNGGIYRALKDNRILEDMQKRGIKHVHVHSVDNILIKVADPVFIGYCVKKNADCGAKVVSKAGPSEAVGVVCQVDGRFQVVEYSEITEATANLRNANGELLFRAGNICNHYFSIDFLINIVNNYEHELKLHVANKKIPYVNESGKRIKPTSPNGIKIEKFVFDVFQFANNFVTWEVPRNTEFSALKNSNEAGKDCPTTSKADLLNLHKTYIENAGGFVTSEDVEISPLISYGGEGLEPLVKGKSFNSSTVISADEESEVNYRTKIGCNGKSL